MEQRYEDFLQGFLSQKQILLNQREIDFFRSVLKSQMLNRGEYFIKVGERPDKIGLVVNGLFRLFYIDAKGNDHTKHFAEENSAIFSYTAYITGRESRYYIEALEDSEILTVSFAIFEKLANDNYNLLLMLKKMVDQAVILKEERESSFLLENGMERYKRFLQERPCLENRVKQYHLASYLGLTPVSLSRIRKKLQLTNDNDECPG